ncbi:MAG: PASTA domain-containing protein, partial [Chloroflexota bacterium]
FPASVARSATSRRAAPTAQPAASPSPTPAPVKVPTLRDVPEADAIVRLQDRGLLAGARERRTNANVAAGAVIRTEPEAGTKVRPGTKVALYISTGPAATPVPTPRPITVPDVRGLEEADALIVLGDAGFTIGERIRATDAVVPAGRVVSTRPAARSQAPAGTRIEVRVSTGPAPTPVPPPTPTPAPTPGPSPLVPVLDGYLSGTLVLPEPALLGPDRDVIVTLVEETTAGSRVVPGRVYVAEGSAPAAFILAYPVAAIDPGATYRVYAAIVDGADAWLSATGTPALTGGAGIAGLVVPLTLRGELLEGEVSGAIVGPPPGLSPAATREVFLVRTDTGAIVGYDAGPVDGRTVLPFSVAFLVDALDPAAPYAVVARVTDGTRTWTGPGVPVVTNGAPFRVVVPVTEVVPGEIPVSAP